MFPSIEAVHKRGLTVANKEHGLAAQKHSPLPRSEVPLKPRLKGHAEPRLQALLPQGILYTPGHRRYTLLSQTIPRCAIGCRPPAVAHAPQHLNTYLPLDKGAQQRSAHIPIPLVQLSEVPHDIERVNSRLLAHPLNRPIAPNGPAAPRPSPKSAQKPAANPLCTALLV